MTGLSYGLPIVIYIYYVPLYRILNVPVIYEAPYKIRTKRNTGVQSMLTVSRVV